MCSSSPGRAGGLLALLLALLLAGCASRPHTFAETRPAGAKPLRVAVLPFRNETANPVASRVVTGAFIVGLAKAGGYKPEFPGNVRNFFIRERIIVREGADLKTMGLMAERLGVDVVVMGQVEEYSGTEDIRRGSTPTVRLSARMADARTGRILFMGRHGRNGDDYRTVLDFGAVHSVAQLSLLVVEELVAKMPRTVEGEAR
ncbi:MAG: GNA1162 family protein [Thermodesulfobacteriota bacterium]